MTRKCLYLMSLIVFLLNPGRSSAEVTFYVAPEEAQAFRIEAMDIDPKASVEITVLYDPALLANPRVSLDWGTVADLFDSLSGTLTFKTAPPEEPGPSFAAHLKFDKTGTAPGGILSVKGRIFESDGTVSRSRTLPNVPVSSDSSLATFTSDPGEPPDADDADLEGMSPATGRNLMERRDKSVLQRFQEFKGKKGLDGFAALFESAPDDSVSQEPSVALSDGKTTMDIRLKLRSKEVASPNFAMSDAKLVNIRKDGEKGWVITALPNKGTWNPSVVLQTDEKVILFPLVVAPPVAIPRGITRGNFLAELERFVSGQAGGDQGKSDLLDRHLYEYIFTANLLAESGLRPAATMPEKPNVASKSK